MIADRTYVFSRAVNMAIAAKPGTPERRAAALVAAAVQRTRKQATARTEIDAADATEEVRAAAQELLTRLAGETPEHPGAQLMSMPWPNFPAVPRMDPDDRPRMRPRRRSKTPQGR
jgi:hypothetical protein